MIGGFSVFQFNGFTLNESDQSNLITQKTFHVEPTVRAITSSEKIIFPQSYSVTTETHTANLQAQFSDIQKTPYLILPLINFASAFPSSQVDVTYEKWDITAGSTQQQLVVTSNDEVFFIDALGSAPKIGRLNILTNDVKFWDLPTVASGPTGLVQDSSGKVYFTMRLVDKIGELDPTTDVIREWDLTTGFDPQGLDIDSSGVLYFTGRTSNKIGQLNPSTNALTEWTITGSAPGRVSLDSSGKVFFTEIALKKVAMLDPATNELTEWDSPTEHNPFAILVFSSSKVYYGASSGGDVGESIHRLDPTTNIITTWPVPEPPTAGGSLAIDSLENVYWVATSHIVRLVPSTGILTDWIPNDCGPLATNGIQVDSSDRVYFVCSSFDGIGRFS